VGAGIAYGMVWVNAAILHVVVRELGWVVTDGGGLTQALSVT